MEKILPITMIVLSLFASVGYLLVGNWRQAIYWAAAAVLNGSVTF